MNTSTDTWTVILEKENGKYEIIDLPFHDVANAGAIVKDGVTYVYQQRRSMSEKTTFLEVSVLKI